MNRYTSPNLSPGQVAQLIAALQRQLEDIPPGDLTTPVCRVVFTEYTARTMVDVVRPQEKTL